MHQKSIRGNRKERKGAIHERGKKKPESKSMPPINIYIMFLQELI
jgi:hypothetical protein